jgi:predicted Zn-dependent protease with MMP-like domain
MTATQFRALVAEAIDTIPRASHDAITNVAIVVEDEPSAELLEEMEMDPDDDLFGLYQGTPLTERQWDYGNALPDRITLYQFPIEEECEGDEDASSTRLATRSSTSWALLRDERGRDHGDRGALLAW